MLDMRSNDDAEGDSKMIGSDRLEDTAKVLGFEEGIAGRFVSCAVFGF